MFVSPIIVWGLMAVLAVSVLVVLVLIARAIGLQKSLKGLAILLMLYPAILIMIRVFDLFEIWVWVLILLAVVFWVLSGRKPAPRKRTRLADENPAPPIRTPAPAVIVASPPAVVDSPPPSQAPPAPARPKAVVVTPPAPAPAKPKSVANPPAPAS